MRPEKTRRRSHSFAAVAVLVSMMAGSAGLAAESPPFAQARVMRVIGAQGVPLNVVQQGDATLPAVLFIHGYRQSHLAWSGQFASDLATRCHLVAFDLRGHGDSGAPWPRNAYDSRKPWADDVARTIDATGLVKPLIVAWSFGGNVAMDFVREHPEVPIAGIVLIGTTAQLLVASDQQTELPASPAASSALAARIASAKPSVEAIFGNGVRPELREQFAAAAMRVGPFVDEGVAARLARGGNADLLPRLTMPITLVFGAHDPIVPKPDIARLEAALPAARVVAFEDSKHAPFLDDIERFDALLDDLQCQRS